MRKTFELPAMEIVKIRKNDVIATSYEVQAIMDGTWDEETIL
jgi:hypothetical protein